jgi:hypothetical protein
VYGALRGASPASPTAPLAPPAGALSPPPPALLAMAEERDAALAREAHWRVRFLAEQAQLQSVVTSFGQEAASVVATIQTQRAEADVKREAADAARDREENILRETAQFQRDAAAKAKAAASKAALQLLEQQDSARDEFEEQCASSAREIAQLREELSAVRGSAAHLRDQLRGAEQHGARVASEGAAAAQRLRTQLDAAQSVAEERARALLLAVTEHESAHRATRAEHAAQMGELAQGHAADRDVALVAHGDALAGELRDAHAAELRALAETHDGALRAAASEHASHRERAAIEYSETASVAAAAAREEIAALSARVARAEARAEEAEAEARRVALEAERSRAHHHAELRRQVRQYSAISEAKSAQLSFEHASALDAVETHYAAQLSAAAAAHDAALDAESRRSVASIDRCVVHLFIVLLYSFVCSSILLFASFFFYTVLIDSVLRTVAAAVRREEGGPPSAAPRDATGSARDEARLRLQCLEAELATLAASADGAEARVASEADFDVERRVDALEREVERQREQLGAGAAEREREEAPRACEALSAQVRCSLLLFAINSFVAHSFVLLLFSAAGARRRSRRAAPARGARRGNGGLARARGGGAPRRGARAIAAAGGRARRGGGGRRARRSAARAAEPHRYRRSGAQAARAAPREAALGAGLASSRHGC